MKTNRTFFSFQNLFGRMQPDISLKYMGYSYEDGVRYSWDGRKRGTEYPFVIFQYTVSGEGCLEFKQKTYRLLRNQAMLLNVPDDHRYYLPAKSGHWEFFWLILCGEELLKIVKTLQKRFSPVFSLSPDGETVSYLHRLQDRKYAEGIRDVYRNSQEAYAFIMTLAAELDRQRILSPEEKIKWIITAGKQLSLECTVEDLRKETGYSQQYFERIFKKKSGKTPTAFLMERRMEYARELLRHTVFPIKEIAGICGFSEVQYFYRVFRKYCHTTPKEYRNR